MNTTSPQTSAFMDSIRWLEMRCESVPQGWQLAYNEMLGKLAAADCPARADITVRGPYLDDLNLRVTQSGIDPVLAGILRRVERATAQTCEVCGQPGKLRCLDRSVKVMCGCCAGPRLASLAVTRVLRDLDETANGRPSDEIWWTTAPVQLRPLIPASAWQLLDIADASPTIYHTSHAQLASHRPWLEAVQRALDQAA